MHHYGWKCVLPSHWSLFIQSRADSCNWGWSPYSGFIKFYCQKWYVFPFCFWQDCVKCSAKCFQRWYKNLLLSFSFMQLSNWNSCLKPDQRQLTRNVGKVCNKKFCYIFFLRYSFIIIMWPFFFLIDSDMFFNRGQCRKLGWGVNQGTLVFVSGSSSCQPCSDTRVSTKMTMKWNSIKHEIQVLLILW